MSTPEQTLQGNNYPPERPFGRPLEINPLHFVSWIKATITERPRHPITGLPYSKIEHVIDDSGQASRRYILAGQIARLADPNLRYALRLTDAAEAVDWIEDDLYASGRDIEVVATDEGVNSTLISATYNLGVNDTHDTLLECLHAADPRRSEQ